jgi:hypothetical protein
MPGVNRQGQAHIVSTASRLGTCVSIDPQPASISPTINISIVFICPLLVDHGRIICHPAIKNDSSAILGWICIRKKICKTMPKNRRWRGFDSQAVR